MLLYCLYVVMLYFTILPFDHLTGVVWLYGYFLPKTGFDGEISPFSGLLTPVFRMRWCFYEGVTTVLTKESSKSLRRSQSGANGGAVFEEKGIFRVWKWRYSPWRSNGQMVKWI